MPHPVRPFPALALLGFMDEAGAVQFASGMFITRARTRAGIVRLWRSHANAVAHLAPWTSADSPALSAADPALVPYLASVEADPLFAATYPAGTWAFAEVEIANLLAFQPHVEIGRYEVTPGAGGLASVEDRARFTLPVALAEPMVVFEERDGAGRSVGASFSSSRPNLMFSGFQGQPQPGLFAFQVTSRPNFTAVARYQDRLYVHNGYHRLVSLLRMGFTTATVVMRDVVTWGEVAPAGQGLFSETLMLTSPRPPMLRDFGDATLAHTGRIRPVMSILRVSYSEQRIPMV